MPKRIYIIDDDEDDIEFLQMAVREVDASCECAGFSNSTEALGLLTHTENGLPDYIFLDLNMPRLNGRSCLQQLKRHQRLSEIPVVIYSTSQRSSDREEMLQMGAAYYFSKPVLYQDVLQIVETVFKRVVC
ncbi:MAG TPA: response regulator [Chitinophagaceae bacterium]|nr:response regulator [Chitinophagaceae bacterium]